MGRTITQRELREEFAAIMDAVERGKTFVITRNGTPVGELRPIRHRGFVPTAELKRKLANRPLIDYAAMRAEMDALFVEERVGD